MHRRWPVRTDGSDDVTVDIPLPHNSFCVMLPPCQELWTHEVVREGGGGGVNVEDKGKDKPPRVSLTFRQKKNEWTVWSLTHTRSVPVHTFDDFLSSSLLTLFIVAVRCTLYHNIAVYLFYLDHSRRRNTDRGDLS